MKKWYELTDEHTGIRLKRILRVSTRDLARRHAEQFRAERLEYETFCLIEETHFGRQVVQTYSGTRAAELAAQEVK